ncbi:nitrogen regulation protein NR(II) [Candidatus Riflebacteria bacterium]
MVKEKVESPRNIQSFSSSLRFRYTLVYISLAFLTLLLLSFLTYRIILFYLDISMGRHLQETFNVIQLVLKERIQVERQMSPLLKKIVEAINLYELTLHRHDKQQILFSTDPLPVNDKMQLLSLDSLQISEAMSGQPGIGVTYLNYKGVYIKRAYFPLEIKGKKYLLALTADGRFFFDLYQFQILFVQILLIIIGLLCILGGISIYWLIQPLRRLLTRMHKFNPEEPWEPLTTYGKDAYGYMNRVFDKVAVSVSRSMQELKLAKNRHEYFQKRRELELSVLYELTKSLDIKELKNFHVRFFQILTEFFPLSFLHLCQKRNDEFLSILHQGDTLEFDIHTLLKNNRELVEQAQDVVFSEQVCMVKTSLLDDYFLVFKMSGEQQEIETMAPFIMVLASLFMSGFVLQKNLKRIFSLKNQMKHLLKSIGTGILSMDKTNRVTYLNPEMKRLLAISHGFSEWSTKFPGIKSYIEKANSRKLKSRHFRLHKDIDIPFHAELSVEPLLGKKGRRHGMVLVLRDITEDVAIEQKLLQAEKMAYLGEMAATIAHEIRNPLASMLGFIELIQKQNGPALNKKSEKYLELLLEEISQLTNLTENFLKFSRSFEIEYTEFKLKTLLEEAIIWTAGMDSSFVLKVDFDLEESLLIKGDFSLLKSVFLNLLLNSRQAMENAGKKAGRVLISATKRDGKVFIQLLDDGPGTEFEPEKIFQPFFTSKAKGSGLGLPMVQKILQQHGGEVKCKKLESGLEFMLILPV